MILKQGIILLTIMGMHKLFHPKIWLLHFLLKMVSPIDDPRSLYDKDNPYDCERDNRFLVNLYYQGRQFGANASYIDVTPGGKDSGYLDVKASRSGVLSGKVYQCGCG